jgi:hypothetical protein
MQDRVIRLVRGVERCVSRDQFQQVRNTHSMPADTRTASALSFFDRNSIQPLEAHVI